MTKKRRMTRWNYLTLSLWLLALGLTGWTLSRLPLDAIASQFSLLAWHNWLLWIFVNIVILYLAIQRWHVLGLALTAPIALSRLFRLRQAGSAISFITPGPHFGGEPLQLLWMRNHFNIPMHRAVAMLGLDRFMETVTNIAVLLAGVLLLLGTTILPIHEWLQISAILAGILAALLIGTALILRHPDWLAKRFSSMTHSWRADSNRKQTQSDKKTGWQSFVDLLKEAVGQHQSRLWLALLLSLAAWGVLIGELVLLLNLLGVSASPSDVVLIMVGIRLAMLLPVPGGLGTIEASLLWSFNVLGFEPSAAIGLIALIRLRDALVLLVGLACLWTFNRVPSQTADASSAE